MLASPAGCDSSGSVEGTAASAADSPCLGDGADQHESGLSVTSVFFSSGVKVAFRM